MHSIRTVIAGNGLALLLTVVILLPTTAVFAFVASAPIDDLFADIGVWLHQNYQWKFDEFDTIERSGVSAFTSSFFFENGGIRETWGSSKDPSIL